MNKFRVLSISDMIYQYPHIKEGNIRIIIITKNKYEYNFVPLLELHFDDITQNETNKKLSFISKEDITEIKRRIPDIKEARIIYVCCDAGISRSPAVASALARYLEDFESYSDLMWRYPYANKDVFQDLLLGLRNVGVAKGITAPDC